VTSSTVELLDVERRIALFAQAITGAPYEVRAAETFTGNGVLMRSDAAMLDSRALYLPASIGAHPRAAMNARTYRLLSLHQLGYREFGTFDFRLAAALIRVPLLQQRAAPAPAPPLRESDLDAFYGHFAAPALVRLLFRLFEAHRIDCRMLAAYPGARDDHHRETVAELARRPPLQVITNLRDILEALVTWSLGVPDAALVERDTTGVVAAMLAYGGAVRATSADVYDTTRAVVQTYALIERVGLIPIELTAVAVSDEDHAALDIERPQLHGDAPTEWLQREERLTDWDEDLASLDALIATEAIDGDADGGDAGTERPPGMDVRQLTDQRDTLARRIEMERNNIRHALGQIGRPNGISFLYDEWDVLSQRYLRGWCRLYESRAEVGTGAAVIEMLNRIAPLQQRVRRQFQQLPLQAFQRTRGVFDGEELDWDRVLDHHIDRRRGVTPDERVYQRRDRITRDVAAAFLIDLSASTDDAAVPPVTPTNPVVATASRKTDDDPLLWEPIKIDAAAPPPRRIIDVLRDSIALMARALDTYGDRYGIYGFSGYGRDNVEFYVAKEFNESLRGSTLRALVGMRPRRSTRMGPAIRHSASKLSKTGSTLKVLIMLSDGFPQDCDYGPDRSDHEYGVADTARALAEAERAGIQTFCLTVDRSGHDYLKRMCPDDRYVVLDDIEALPDALSKVYQKLTA
jgi:hypothetical protein